MRAVTWALGVMAIGLGLSGCNVGIGECHGNQGAPVVSGGGGEGGEGGGRLDPFDAGTGKGSGGEGGSGGSGMIETKCAKSIANWPPPPAQALGFRVDLALPDGFFLMGIQVQLIPAHGHVQVPAILPAFAVVQAPVPLPDSISNIGTAQDDSADVATYENPHPLEWAALGDGVPINIMTTTYAVIATGEGGVGTVSGGAMSDWRCRLRKP